MSSLQFQVLEDPVRRKVYTSSIAGAEAKGIAPLSKMRGFELVPGEVHFGTLCEGCTYAFTVNLKNFGIDSCRYKVKQPPPATGLQVVYKPGPVSTLYSHIWETYSMLQITSTVEILNIHIHYTTQGTTEQEDNLSS